MMTERLTPPVSNGTIWKVDLGPQRHNPSSDIEVPSGAVILRVAAGQQPLVPAIWFLLDPSNPYETRRFDTWETGETLPSQYKGTFIGWYVLPVELVYFVFEV